MNHACQPIGRQKTKDLKANISDCSKAGCVKCEGHFGILNLEQNMQYFRFSSQDQDKMSAIFVPQSLSPNFKKQQHPQPLRMYINQLNKERSLPFWLV